jgi:5-methylcytosine-specific restriction endonuclease McrA
VVAGATALLVVVALALRLRRWLRYRARYVWSGHRRPIPDTTRWLIFARARYRCAYCGHLGDEVHPLEVDHIRPVAEGGDNHPSNLVSACRPCNREKGRRWA